MFQIQLLLIHCKSVGNNGLYYLILLFHSRLVRQQLVTGDFTTNMKLIQVCKVWYN